MAHEDVKSTAAYAAAMNRYRAAREWLREVCNRDDMTDDDKEASLESLYAAQDEIRDACARARTVDQTSSGTTLVYQPNRLMRSCA